MITIYDGVNFKKIMWRTKSSKINIQNKINAKRKYKFSQICLTAGSIIRHIAIIVVRSSITSVMAVFMFVMFFVAVRVMMGDLWLGDNLVRSGLVLAVTLESYEGRQ